MYVFMYKFFTGDAKYNMQCEAIKNVSRKTVYFFKLSTKGHSIRKEIRRLKLIETYVTILCK